jgi:hypothetical protein
MLTQRTLDAGCFGHRTHSVGLLCASSTLTSFGGHAALARISYAPSSLTRFGHSFLQDVRGGTPVQVEGTDLPLYAMEIDPEQVRACNWKPEELQ